MCVRRVRVCVCACATVVGGEDYDAEFYTIYCFIMIMHQSFCVCVADAFIALAFMHSSSEVV